MTDKFERLVHDEIRMVLHHRREVALTSKIIVDGRSMVTFNEREKVIERLSFVVINPDKLTVSQMDIFKLVCHDLVQFVNQSLVIPSFRREPP